MTRLVLHVTPDDTGKWKIERDGGGEQAVFEDKDHAVTEATTKAKAAETGQIIVHGRDGKIQCERTDAREGSAKHSRVVRPARDAYNSGARCVARESWTSVSR